jgi:hypothetical protein
VVEFIFHFKLVFIIIHQGMEFLAFQAYLQEMVEVPQKVLEHSSYLATLAKENPNLEEKEY